MDFIKDCTSRFSGLLYFVTYLQMFCYGLLLPPIQTITKSDINTDFYLFILPLLFTYIFENIYDINSDTNSLYNYDKEMKVLKSANIIIIFIMGALFINLINGINILEFFHISKKIDTLYIFVLTITCFFITFVLCIIQDTRLDQSHQLKSKNLILFFKYLSIIIIWIINLVLIYIVSLKGDIFVHIGIYLFINFVATIAIDSIFNKKIERLNKNNIVIMKKFTRKNKKNN
ncbi:TPA: hypothetical protein PD491_002600 [Staphylococcus aureus]|uniref:hypothetical protein n=1 Tax=Mammaliicoccus TaxID=2803850 RepID=UPI001C4E1362|nr:MULTISPECIES: hypothetical protein [Mammaliicoccus]MBW0769090.1 hypothetical protein [Mammaliicoccus lentus]HDE8789968.1 hypothetical protein [Staphylococcus aureus]